MKVIKVSDKLYTWLTNIARKEKIPIGAALEKLLEGKTQISEKEVTAREAKLTEEKIKEIIDMEIEKFMSKFPLCPNCGALLFPSQFLETRPPSREVWKPFKCWHCGKLTREVAVKVGVDPLLK